MVAQSWIFLNFTELAFVVSIVPTPTMPDANSTLNRSIFLTPVTGPKRSGILDSLPGVGGVLKNSFMSKLTPDKFPDASLWNKNKKTNNQNEDESDAHEFSLGGKDRNASLLLPPLKIAASKTGLNKESETSRCSHACIVAEEEEIVSHKDSCFSQSKTPNSCSPSCRNNCSNVNSKRNSLQNGEITHRSVINNDYSRDSCCHDHEGPSRYQQQFDENDDSASFCGPAKDQRLNKLLAESHSPLSAKKSPKVNTTTIAAITKRREQSKDNRHQILTNLYLEEPQMDQANDLCFEPERFQLDLQSNQVQTVPPSGRASRSLHRSSNATHTTATYRNFSSQKNRRNSLSVAPGGEDLEIAFSGGGDSLLNGGMNHDKEFNLAFEDAAVSRKEEPILNCEDECCDFEEKEAHGLVGGRASEEEEEFNKRLQIDKTWLQEELI
eukprot:GDKJ01017775.1.p1 GENE.GDKJ01017775.1~~GDKJ01017775.1.p1  ORF type:complete len:439 (-),score=88.16 GDKJ01017775.1:676-1992(-)